MTVETLLYGLMLRSGNDAATALAEHAGGSVEGFVKLMNERAVIAGLTNTVFYEPFRFASRRAFVFCKRYS